MTTSVVTSNAAETPLLKSTICKSPSPSFRTRVPKPDFDLKTAEVESLLALPICNRCLWLYTAVIYMTHAQSSLHTIVKRAQTVICSLAVYGRSILMSKRRIIIWLQGFKQNLSICLRVLTHNSRTVAQAWLQIYTSVILSTLKRLQSKKWQNSNRN